MKKKLKIEYEKAEEEDSAYYLKHAKKAAMKKAEEIFGDAEFSLESMLEARGEEMFNMNEIYNTDAETPDFEIKVSDGYLSNILVKIKKQSHQIASEIFKTE